MRFRFLAPLVLCLGLIAGCGVTRTTTAPDAARDAAPTQMMPAMPAAPGGFQARSAADFFPLEIGNRWRYLNTLTTVTTPTGGEPGEPVTVSDERDAELTNIDTLDGRDYVVERSDYISEEPIVGLTSFAYWRQDASGLYQHDPPPAKGAASRTADRFAARGWTAVAARLGPTANLAAWQRAWDRLQAKRALLAALFGPGGAGPYPGEIQSLAYPLRKGATWTIREDPRFTGLVEGHISVDSPAGRFAGWSVGIDNEFLVPGDEVHAYYGRAGFLGLTAHLTAIATDDTGQPIGTLDAHETQTLLEVALVGGASALALPQMAPRRPGD